MSRNFVCPYTGQHLDFDALAGHNSVNHRPGKWSNTLEPYDEVALANLDLSAMESREAKKSLLLKYLSAISGINSQLGIKPLETENRAKIRAMAREFGISVIRGAEDLTPVAAPTVDTTSF